MLRLFEVKKFEELTEWMKDPDLEGFDEDNISHFYGVLKARLFDRVELPAELLLGYDENIVRYWRTITEKRNVQGKFFIRSTSIPILLFTEIYLDRYFSDREALLKSLNQHVDKFNEYTPHSEQIEAYSVDDLNKIAFWSATGSGKTLLMHINILQYKHYLKKHNRERELNRIILLTRMKDYRQQHLGEFELSNIKADLFSKEGRSLYSGGDVEIIDIHKLREESGEKTVAVEAFEGNNLVMVDEGHRGSEPSSESRPVGCNGEISYARMDFPLNIRRPLGVHKSE